MRLVVATLALAFALGGCGSASGREAELAEYATLVPSRGAYVRLLTADGERWRATFNADDEKILIHGAWHKEGKFSTMGLGPDSTAKLWKMQLAVMAAGAQPAWRHDPNIKLEIALGDGDKAVLIKTHGLFVEGSDAKAFFDYLKGFVPDPDDPANGRQKPQ
jgi:hypothetical protein